MDEDNSRLVKVRFVICKILTIKLALLPTSVSV